MTAARIPPIQCLLTFEALARLRSVTQASEELCVTPSAVSHRVKQLEQIIGTKLFGRSDFSLTVEGIEYLADVREGLATLQVSIPLQDVVAADADLMVRFGTGRYADVEHVCLMKDEVTPLASPACNADGFIFMAVLPCPPMAARHFASQQNHRAESGP